MSPNCTNLRLTVDRPLGGGHWRRRRRGVHRLLGGGRFVDRGSRGGLGVHWLGRGDGDRGGGWRGRDASVCPTGAPEAPLKAPVRGSAGLAEHLLTMALS